MQDVFLFASEGARALRPGALPAAPVNKRARSGPRGSGGPIPLERSSSVSGVGDGEPPGLDLRQGTEGNSSAGRLMRGQHSGAQPSRPGASDSALASECPSRCAVHHKTSLIAAAPPATVGASRVMGPDHPASTRPYADVSPLRMQPTAQTSSPEEGQAQDDDAADYSQEHQVTIRNTRRMGRLVALLSRAARRSAAADASSNSGDDAQRALEPGGDDDDSQGVRAHAGALLSVSPETGACLQL